MSRAIATTILRTVSACAASPYLTLSSLVTPSTSVGDLVAEVAAQRRPGVYVGVLDRVVQQRRAQRRRRHAELGQDRGDRERVGDVRVAALAQLAAVVRARRPRRRARSARRSAFGWVARTIRNSGSRTGLTLAALRAEPGEPGPHPARRRARPATSAGRRRRLGCRRAGAALPGVRRRSRVGGGARALVVAVGVDRTRRRRHRRRARRHSARAPSRDRRSPQSNEAPVAPRPRLSTVSRRVQRRARRCGAAARRPGRNASSIRTEQPDAPRRPPRRTRSSVAADRAAGGEHVVDDQHPVAGREGVARAPRASPSPYSSVVRLPRASRRAACPSCAPARSRRRRGRRPARARMKPRASMPTTLSTVPRPRWATIASTRAGEGDVVGEQRRDVLEQDARRRDSRGRRGSARSSSAVRSRPRRARRSLAPLLAAGTAAFFALRLAARGPGLGRPVGSAAAPPRATAPAVAGAPASLGRSSAPSTGSAAAAVAPLPAAGWRAFAGAGPRARRDPLGQRLASPARAP